MVSGEFIVYPAIDLRGGRVVRLQQGDISKETRYADDPALVADEFTRAGARWLHVIDLDGALNQGQSPNDEALLRILEHDIPVQFGGGLRTLDQIEAALKIGVARVLIGTLALEAPDQISALVDRWGPDRISVALDASKGGLVSRGWTETTKLDPVSIGNDVRKRGVDTVLVTDVQRDGMGTGINLEYARRISESCGLSVIAAGGANSIDDVRAARDASLSGIVLGRALYEGEIGLEEALQC